MKRFILTLLTAGLAGGLFAQSRPHTVPESDWKKGYVQQADTTTAARLDNGNDPSKYWRVYNARVLDTDWFRISEYMTLYYWVGDTIVSQDNDINFIFKTGNKVYNDTSGVWAIEPNTINTEFTVNVTSVGAGIIKITGDYTIGTGPWGLLELSGASAAANDSTIVILQYDGYDTKGR